MAREAWRIGVTVVGGCAILIAGLFSACSRDAQAITPHNGQITFSPTIPAPTPPSPKTECPNGNWTVQLTSLTYSNVVLHIQQPPGTDLLTFSFGTIDP